MAQQEKEITIEDLELSLEVYELQSQQKLAKLQNLFKQKGSLDPAKMFYEDRSSLQVKFQNIIADLLEFLVKQEVASTEKLRKTFYRILESPLLLLFKVSRFQIFDLRLNGFDIQLEPIEAIQQLAASMYKNIQQYTKLTQQQKPKDSGSREYESYQQFLIEALINAIQDKIFILYSYLRKGSAVLKKKFQNKVKIVEIFNNIENKLLKKLLQIQDWKTIKELSTLNYQIYLLENTFDVLYFYLMIPFKPKALDIFKELQLLAEKAKQASNYDLFIFIFVKNYKEIIHKIKNEGIDPIYYPYIENTLTTLLQLWGCKLCLYKQFGLLFESLFNLYQPRAKILQLCLKHSPKLQKQDIVLMRTHFKIDAKKNYEQLLSLLNNQTLQQINSFLSSFFHKSLYNLDFRTLGREQLINLLTLLNGNSSFDQFFGVVERAMKQWNHTIDFNHSHKFIHSQFSYPKLSPRKVLESLNLLKNFCALEDKNFNKLYEPIIKAGAVTKALLGLIKFLHQNISNQEVSNIVKEQMCQQLFVQSFHFLVRCSDQIEQICETFSKVTKHIASQERKRKIADSMVSIIGAKIDSFHIMTLIKLFQQITNSYNPDQKYTKQLISLMMSETQQINQSVKCFSLIGQPISNFQNRKISQKQANFLKESTFIKNGTIVAKHNGVFKLSQFQVVTNPIQFDRIMDNYYFNLEQNSKRFVQYLVQSWTELAFQNNQIFFMQCLIQLIKQYLIAIPLLCSTRVSNEKILKKQQSSRFVELLCHSLGKIPKVEQLFNIILNCRGIRYKNGLDYIRQEINPMILKQLIGILNTSNEPNVYVSAYEIATLCLKNINLSQIKLDVIQKTIQLLNYSIGASRDANEIQRLSQCHFNLIKIFFMKKQIDMRKNNLADSCGPLLWNDIRQHTAKKAQQLKPKQYQRVNISEQIIVSPFTIAKDFQLQNYKIAKAVNKPIQGNTRTLQANLIISSLQKQEDEKFNMSLLPKLSDTVRKIDLKNLGWNLRLHLGEDNITALQHKQNIIIDQGVSNQYIANKTDEQNKTLIQYYLKQLQQPSINDEIIIKTIENLLQSQQKISTTWTNPLNFQRIFIDLNVILACSEKEIPQNKANSIIANIVNLLRENPLKAAKRTLDIFSQIGYSDLWAQSYSTLSVKTKLSESLKEFLNFDEGFLPILLRICLQKQQLKEHLDNFLKNLFESRPSQQNTLMYKVTIDKHLLNLIMKSLHIKHLNEISLMIHSNFNNLRLYTDQLHQGLKALNIASKNRSYNQFIQLSKEFEDQQYLGPVKLFKQNFAFFIRIEKDGYLFKKNEQIRLTIQRVGNCLRSEEQNKLNQINKIMDEHTQQIKKLQLNIANRVKSFYLVTKLRDLSYQNSFTMTLLHEILAQAGKSSEQILAAIDKAQIFTLVNEMFNSLVLFEKNWTNMNRYHLYPQIDKKSIQSDITICSTRRFSHSMSKIYEACDLEYDEILQRCYQVLKMFFLSKEGHQYLSKNKIYPPFLVRNFILNNNQNKQFLQAIKKQLNKHKLNQQYSFEVKNQHLIADSIKGLRSAPKTCFYNKKCKVIVNGVVKQLESIVPLVVQHMKKTQTLILTKDNAYLIFNKYKTSQATLEEIEILSYLIAYCLYQDIKIDLPLHPSLISVISFNIAQIDDLLNIDFQVWQDLRNVLTTADSKTLNLNFSYTIQSLTTFQKQRVELIDKGASKKVNNLNRQQFADLICCRIIYKNYERQINRMLQSILTILPKQYISTLPISYFAHHLYNNDAADQFIKSLMKKIGIQTPDVIFVKGTKIDNLKDYQNVNWLQELILQKKQLRKKYWPDQTNVFVVTTIGSTPSLHVQGNLIIIKHFATKEDLQAALNL